MAKEKQLTVEEKILQHLKENGQMLSWLAKKIKVSTGHLHSVLKGKDDVKRTLTDKKKQAINSVLKTNF